MAPTDETEAALARVRAFATRYRGNRYDQLTDYERKALDSLDSLLARVERVERERDRLREAMGHVARSAHLAHEMLMGSVHGEPAAAQFVESCLRDIRSVAVPDVQRKLDFERFAARGEARDA